MERPDLQQGGSANHNQQERDCNLYCSETLRSTVSENPQGQPGHLGRTDTADNPYCAEGTRLSDSPGATTFSGFHFPAVGSTEWACYLRQFNKHLQSTNQTETIPTDNRRTGGELPAMDHVDSTHERQRTTLGISDTGSPVFGESPNNTADGPGNDTPAEPSHSMEIQRNGVVQPHRHESPIPGPSGQAANIGKKRREPTTQRKRKASSSEEDIYQSGPSSEEDEGSNVSFTFTREEESETEDTTGLGSRKRRRPNSPGGHRTSREWYAFIIHKENQEPNWKQSAAKYKQAPSFASFDHGDHYHIIFPGTATGNNVTRTRTRIGKYLGATAEGRTEIATTTIKVRWIKRFLLYCIRYGIETANIYGSTIRTTLTEISTLFKELFTERNPDDIIHGQCAEYEERGKKRRSYNVKSKMNNLVDVVRQNIKKYNVETLQQWESRVPKGIKLRLLKEYGLSYESYVSKCIRYNRADIINDIKTKTLTDLMITHVAKLEDDKEFFNFVHTQLNWEILNWINIYFARNELNAHEVFAWNEIIKTKRYQKINGLVYEGPTNAGKSLINDNIIRANCKPEVVPKQNDNSSFHLDQLPGASCVIFQEPFITPTNVGTWKELLEGAEIKVDQKNKDKEPIPRVPIFITTASNLCCNIDGNETLQIQQRIKSFKLRCTIHHKDDEYTGITEKGKDVIKKTPGFMYPIHWAIIWLMNFEQMYQYIREQDHKNTVTNQCIELTEEWYINAEKYSTLANKVYEKCRTIFAMLRK